MKSVMDARSPATARSDAGFALIEVIVSAAVLAMMALAVLSGIDGATSASGREKARSVAAALAEQDQERLRSMPVEQLATYVTTDTPTSVGGSAYNVNSKVEWVRDDTGGTISCANDGHDSDYLHITSTVTSAIVGARTAPVKVDSIVAPNIEYSTTHGSLAVKVINSAGQPVTNLPVTPTGASSPPTQNTNAQGCALFQNITTGSYTVTLNMNLMVDKLGNQIATKPATVGQGKLTLIQMDYDFAGKISASIQTYKPGSTTATAANIIASQAPRVSAENSANVGWLKNLPLMSVLTPPDASPFLITDLFPLSTAYPVFTGGCHYSNPTFDSANSGYYGTNPGSAAVTPGGTASVNVLQPPLNLQMTKDRNSSSPPADGTVAVYAKPAQASGDSCVEPKIRLNTFTTSDGAGIVGRSKQPTQDWVDAGVPFGYYTICFERPGPRYTVWPTDYPGNGTTYDNTDPLGQPDVSSKPIAVNATSTGSWHSGTC
jgi:Tfp pilus assembly protein PilV